MIFLIEKLQFKSILHYDNPDNSKGQNNFFSKSVINPLQVIGIGGKAKLVISDLHCRVLLSKEIVCDEVLYIERYSEWHLHC